MIEVLFLSKSKAQDKMQTPRLILKPIHKKYFEAMLPLYMDPEVMKFVGKGKAYSKAQTLARLNYEINYSRENPSFGKRIIFRKSDQQLLGWATLQHLTPNGEIEIGYRLMKNYWGNGYATEASLPLLDFAFQELKLQELVAAAYLENKGSVNVLKKLGLKFIDKRLFGAVEAGYFKITRSEWENKL